MTVPILVPRRADHAGRDRIWNTIRETVWRNLGIVEGHHVGPGPFNRSAALNDAASQAGDWQTAVIADADSIVSHEQLWAAIGLAERTQRLVFAHSLWVNIDAHEVADFLDAGAVEWRDDRAVYHHTVSSMLAVPRSVWDAVGGFDEAFVGYGYEDNAFARACRVLTGDPLRIFGPVYHLAHDDSPRPRMSALAARDVCVAANRARWIKYKTAKTPEQIRALREALVPA